MNALNEALALSEFLNNLVNQNYDLDMTTEEGMKLAVKAINAALQRDNASGDGFDIVVIDKDKIKKVMTKEFETKLTL